VLERAWLRGRQRFEQLFAPAPSGLYASGVAQQSQRIGRGKRQADRTAGRCERDEAWEREHRVAMVQAEPAAERPPHQRIALKDAQKRRGLDRGSGWSPEAELIGMDQEDEACDPSEQSGNSVDDAGPLEGVRYSLSARPPRRLGVLDRGKQLLGSDDGGVVLDEHPRGERVDGRRDSWKAAQRLEYPLRQRRIRVNSRHRYAHAPAPTWRGLG
jgi:hypothetical protein